MNRNVVQRIRFRVMVAMVAFAGGGILAGCTTPPPPVVGGNDNGSATDGVPRWRPAFDAGALGVLSAVWGSGPADVFVVGGVPDRGEVYHFDGAAWRQMTVPCVPLLVWVFGFGPDDVYAVGEDGGMVHYDGAAWTGVETGTDEDLWGIWGSAPDDMWIVGGDVGGGGPVLLHFDGTVFVPFATPENDRQATSLFKVWGIGSRTFAVGENGLIIEFDGTAWAQVPAGAAADDDFVALWGTSEDHVVAVGGRATGRLAVFDGTTWTTQVLSAVPGLNAVYMVAPDEAIIGGVNGFVGVYDPTTDTLVAEAAETQQTIHAAWGDGAGRVYAVGGRFSPPFTGLALVRSAGDTGPGTEAPSAPNCTTGADCAADFACTAGVCVKADAPQLDLGVTSNGAFESVPDGAAMPLIAGFQGLSEIRVTVRVTGLVGSPDAGVLVAHTVTLADDGTVLSILPAFAPITLLATEDADVFELRDRQIVLEGAPGELDGREAVVSMTLTDAESPCVTATVTRTVVLTLPQ
ncbi:MAG: hypothetical protein ACE5E6_02350 [Phycisphaerae bacterium]